MLDLHRHDEFSTFDGFGNALELAQLAKELGHTALGTSNHGNTNGLIQTYKACKIVGIKPVLGVEAYFLPVYKEQHRGYHLCLFAKNLQGYKNLNRLMYEGEKIKYYNPIITFEMLEKYHEGLIVTTACISGYLAECIVDGNLKQARKYLLKMQNIFGNDFYVEIQPYKIDNDGTQEIVNKIACEFADELGIKCILTSDSHRGRKDDLPSYVKMHEVANHRIEDIVDTYSERYMPTEKELYDRFLCMHTPSLNGRAEWSLDKTSKRAKEMISNLELLEKTVDGDLLDGLTLELPRIDDTTDSKHLLLEKVKQGLKRRDKSTKEYIQRCKMELDVIFHHGFEDYFLIVTDYVQYAKSIGIVVGPGRGSVCNCLVAYALGITDVDSIKFNLDFNRFLRKDKKKFPDIDLDFETKRRAEIIEYLVDKYKGHSARICSYGRYKVDNLANDLSKVCGLSTNAKDIENEMLTESDVQERKDTVKAIKAIVKEFIDEDGSLDKEYLLKDKRVQRLNRMYDDIFVHFSKLYNKVRYIGTHAAGVAITGGNILDYTALRIAKDGGIYTNYDLSDIEGINVIKFDILGLKTMEGIGELRESTGVSSFDEKWIEDEVIMEGFRNGGTDGVFQFEKSAAKEILSGIQCDCFEDIIATNAMNRPVPLKMGVPEQYAENKQNIARAQDKIWYPYTKDTYGTVIYQEQLINICRNLANMPWESVDKLMKIIKKPINEHTRPIADELKKEFVKGMYDNNGTNKKESADLFESFLAYLFNKGHATGYSLISVEEMYYKIYHPTEYWYVKMKNAKESSEVYKFALFASKQNVLVFPPHVNYSADFSLRKVDGEKVIQMGLISIKGVGEKAAEVIETERKEHGNFKSKEDFIERCKNRAVTTRVINTLDVEGALEFNKSKYLKRVIKYNSSLLGRA